MKTSFFPSALLSGTLLFSMGAVAEKANEEWQNTTITDAAIKKIQEAKYEHKKCVGEQMQKPAYLNMEDSRKATDEIIKQCEPALAKMRGIYLAEKVPGIIADRHLRQIRIQVTRKALQGLMFAQATRKAGQP
jgi:hypothetical protein